MSEEILAKLIGGNSRTTSRSTTVSESVLSALSSCRTDDETPQHTAVAIRDHTEKSEARSDGVQSTSTVVTNENIEDRSHNPNIFSFVEQESN